jgi:hypothetical protein
MNTQLRRRETVGIPDEWEKRAEFIRFEYEDDKRYAVYRIPVKPDTNWPKQRKLTVVQEEVSS